MSYKYLSRVLTIILLLISCPCHVVSFYNYYPVQGQTQGCHGGPTYQCCSEKWCGCGKVGVRKHMGVGGSGHLPPPPIHQCCVTLHGQLCYTCMCGVFMCITCVEIQVYYIYSRYMCHIHIPNM